ncbi:E3 ubiquitin-protein ligase RHF2A-like isoform X1 [Rhodamnia argentea]|uniref:RING-type E3 ubiquitin transferase n=1 Tax=Rhodamnia argentea TaxID=178133 RepID=A0A8B8PA24_9MYRT|nr:E3 ubiquitin-protein ligase RHF2A-like isoform X1 [Rhodamnia argentea]XP_030531681.1 E3 ubiquitin-protein ligase RHF2A-like isoform X1 [Rhodamnia argentea]
MKCVQVLDEEAKRAGDHMTSAAAFVEGGIQEANDDACSICLEEFCDSDPSTVTCCKHEFHLQCILEWCQRSSQCPMCWQPISLKDSSSQELLEAVVRERNIRLTPRNPTIFHHPALGDFELQHLPVGANDAELEERIIQHLAAAAAMGRAHHLSRREGHRGRPSGHGRPHFLVFSAHPNGAHSGPVSGSLVQVEGESQPAAVARPSVPLESTGDDSPRQILIQTDQVSSSASGSPLTPTNRQGISLHSRSSAGHPSSPSQDRAGPSEFQTLSDSLKSKWNAVSMRYKESLSKSTKGWRERFFPRHTSVADHNTEVRREVIAGINDVPHMMGNLEIRDNSDGNGSTESSNQSADYSADEAANQSSAENREVNPSNEVNSSAAGTAGSVSI